MENVTELIEYIEDNLLDLEFETNILFKISDICLKNYEYKPIFNEVNIIIHKWHHKIDNSILPLKTVRQFITDELIKLFNNLQTKYLQQVRFTPGSNLKHDILHRKIKKIGEICIQLRKDNIYKSFVDYYLNGYLN